MRKEPAQSAVGPGRSGMTPSAVSCPGGLLGRAEEQEQKEELPVSPERVSEWWFLGWEFPSQVTCLLGDGPGGQALWAEVGFSKGGAWVPGGVFSVLTGQTLKALLEESCSALWR